MQDEYRSYVGAVVAERILPTLSHLIDQQGEELAATVRGRKPRKRDIIAAQQALIDAVADVLSLCKVSDSAEGDDKMLSPSELADSEFCREWLTDAAYTKPEYRLSDEDYEKIFAAIKADQERRAASAGEGK